MTADLHYDLSDDSDRHAYRCAIHGEQLAYVLNEIVETVRREVKHNNASGEFIREAIVDIINDEPELWVVIQE